MAFKLKFQGKSKELYGSDNAMVRKGLVTPAYLMEGPGDEKKVKAEADKKASEDMKVVKTETRKVDGGTEKIEYLEGIGKGEGFSKDPSEREKQKQWIKDNPELYKKLLAEKKKTDKRVTFTPDDKPKEDPKPDPKPKQDAKVSADQIGTELYNKIYSQVKDKRVYDSELGYKRPKTKEEILDEAERGGSELVSQYRKATKAKTDDTVVIGSTGDADRIKNVVTDQLQQKTVSNALDPATIIKGAMMVKNLIGKKKDK